MKTFRIIAESTGIKMFRIGLLAAALLAPFGVWAQQVTTRPVTIQVSDQGGAPIPHAEVRLTPSPHLYTALETDEHGNLSLNLKVGNHAVVVSATGFKNWSESIYVVDTAGGASVPQLYQVILQVGTYSGAKIIYPKDSLVLTAGVYHAPVILSPADFRALRHATITVHNDHTKGNETYSGVPLATLLAKVNAPLGKEFHHEALTIYLAVSGLGGDSAVLSLAEVDSSFHRGQVLVADALDGQRLVKSGPYQLVVSEDKSPVRWIPNVDCIALQSSPPIR